jgi:hypothetical protein
MIPVGVREKKINVVSVLVGQLVAKPSNPGSGINSNVVRISKLVVSPPYFKYSLPETGIEPLDPQHVIIMLILSREI